MATSDAAHPATVVSGHLVLTQELRDRIRERLLGILDATTRRLERHDEQSLSDTSELLDAIQATHAALVKLDAGYYGVCETCEGPIPFERLDAIPNARRCVPCHARAEALVG